MSLHCFMSKQRRQMSNELAMKPFKCCAPTRPFKEERTEKAKVQRCLGPMGVALLQDHARSNDSITAYCTNRWPVCATASTRATRQTTRLDILGRPSGGQTCALVLLHITSHYPGAQRACWQQLNQAAAQGVPLPLPPQAVFSACGPSPGPASPCAALPGRLPGRVAGARSPTALPVARSTRWG